MNQIAGSSTLDTLQSRFALQVTARLSQRCDELGPDLGERLRAAREQAIGRAQAMRRVEASSQVGVTGAGAALLGAGSRWWLKIASALPALALVAGLVLIQQMQFNAQIADAAEIDAGLLADDLPPSAYSDAGFAEFLKTPPRE